jgi:hypothetical protein
MTDDLQQKVMALMGHPGYRYPGVAPQPAPEPPKPPKRKPLDPPKLVSGKPRDQWTPDEERDAAHYAMFKTGRKGPSEAQYSIPAIPGSACDIEKGHMGSAAGWEF